MISDVLNVSGRFNTKDSTDVATIGDNNQGEPYFEVLTTDNKNGSPYNVSALIGKTAFLTCTVKNLGKSKSVRTFKYRVKGTLDLILLFYWIKRSISR